MKLLLDECLPARLRHDIVGHEVFSVQFMGWSGLKNGQLLNSAASAGFDAMITLDRGLEHEFASPPIAVIVLKVDSSRLEHLKPLIPILLNSLKQLPPRAVTHLS